MTALLEYSTSSGICWEQPIVSPVTVVGSGIAADVQLPTGEPHIATVEYRKRRYYVHNRSSQILRIRGRKLRPGGVRKWSSGHVLVVDSTTRIVLWHDTNLTPVGPTLATHPANRSGLPPAFCRRSPIRTKWVIAFGALALFSLLFLRASQPLQVEVSEFEAAIVPWFTPAGERVPVATAPSRNIVRHLQQAREFELAGEANEAAATYALLRNYLQGLGASGQNDPRIPVTLVFVLNRMTVCGGR